MNRIPPLLALVAFAAVTLGVPFGLYALLTRGRRRMMREIRRGAEVRGWRYRLRRWQGNPTAFRIDGSAGSGLPWTIASGGTRGYDRGWTCVLELRVPQLGGQVDFAILPRDPTLQQKTIGGAISPSGEARVAKFSSLISSGLEFLKNARELPSGLAEFDRAYEILVLPQQFSRSPLDAALAQKFLHWPTDAVAPHSVLAWRQAFGFCLDARLPGPANWRNVEYLASLAEEICPRMAAPLVSATPPTALDRVLGKIMQP